MGTYYAKTRDRLNDVSDLEVGSLAQRTVMIDDEFRRVSHFHFKPGDETGWHKHEHPYFVVYLTDCKLLHMPRDAPETIIAHKARESRHIEAGVEHHVRSVADYEVELLEIEYKK
jgi:beta-alanine degradation protein BauB